MQSEPNPKIIEDLKAAGEELKMSSPLSRRSVAAELPREVTSKPSAKIDLPKKIEEYQKEISQEQSVLEKTHQQVKELEKKLGERIEFLKGLQTKGIEINKELKEFQEQLALAKKENSGLLDEVKSKLGKEL